MDLLVVGINHQTAPVALRERVAFTPEQLGDALPDLRAYAQTEEVAVLSTCNRTEILLLAPAEARQRIIEWLASYHELRIQDLEQSLYHHAGSEAIRHVFRVACGLDSMILGEPQIFGQVKDCFQVARDNATLGTHLDKLSQVTNRVAKRVRTETGIGESSVSAAATAVTLASQLFSDLSNCNAMLIGAGEMIELSARHLKGAGVENIVIANRTMKNAIKLATEFDGIGTDLSSIPQRLVNTDILIASTASQLPILGKGTVERALKERRHRPIFMVDLAVPRDIEPEVSELRDVYLYSIDDLQGIIDENLEKRQQEAARAERLISDEVANYQDQSRERASVDTLVEFRRAQEAIKLAELEKAMERLEKGEPADEVLKSLANKLTNKMIHTPSIKLKQASKEGRGDLVAALEELFDLGKL